MTDSEILQQVRTLCGERRYDEAIKLTNEISNKEFAVRAHLLCMEHEQRYHLDREKQ